MGRLPFFTGCGERQAFFMPFLSGRHLMPLKTNRLKFIHLPHFPFPSRNRKHRQRADYTHPTGNKPINTKQGTTAPDAGQTGVRSPYAGYVHIALRLR